MPKLIGYARVSTEDQNPSLQIEALRQVGCTQIFCDHGASGAKRDRPELTKALKCLSSGDKFIVWKLDRLARSVSHLIQLIDDFDQRNIQFESLTEKIDTGTAHGEFLFHILAGFAQMERKLISERTKAGMEEARRRGVVIGRPSKLSEADAIDVQREIRDEKTAIKSIACERGVDPVTIWRTLKRYGLAA